MDVITVNEKKEVINFKESKEGCMEGFGGRKWKG